MPYKTENATKTTKSGGKMPFREQTKKEIAKYLCLISLSIGIGNVTISQASNTNDTKITTIKDVAAKLGVRNHPAIPVEACKKIFSQPRLPASDFVFACANAGYGDAVKIVAWIENHTFGNGTGAKSILASKDISWELSAFSIPSGQQKSFASMSGLTMHCANIPEDPSCFNKKDEGLQVATTYTDDEYDRMMSDGKNVTAWRLLASAKEHDKRDGWAERACAALMHGNGVILDYDKASDACLSVKKPNPNVKKMIGELNDLKNRIAKTNLRMGKPENEKPDYSRFHERYMSLTHACRIAPEVGTCKFAERTPLPKVIDIPTEQSPWEYGIKNEFPFPPSGKA